MSGWQISFRRAPVKRPSNVAHLWLSELLARVRRLIGLGANAVVVLALLDEAKPFHDPNLAAKMAGLGAPVFACRLARFPT